MCMYQANLLITNQIISGLNLEHTKKELICKLNIGSLYDQECLILCSTRKFSEVELMKNKLIKINFTI